MSDFPSSKRCQAEAPEEYSNRIKLKDRFAYAETPSNDLSQLIHLDEQIYLLQKSPVLI